MKKLLLFCVLAVSITACKKYFGKVNENPNNPNSVEPKVILPGIEAAISYTFGGDAARFSGILNQQIKGVERQWTVLEQYKFNGSDVENMYESNIYTKILMEIKKLKETATKNGYHHYNGISKSLEAYTVLFLADFWDSAPYSEALNGFNNIQPAYDSQEKLYATVFDLLEQARADLGQADGGAKTPSDDDLIYNGDVNKWIEFTYFLEARANLRLAKKDASKYQDALNAINNGLSADTKFPYPGGAISNPMYQFIQDWPDITIGKRMSELLTNYNDPRNALYDQPFNVDDNTYILGDKPHVIASLIEQAFIKAECKFQISGAASAHNDYIEGITLALQRDGISQTNINTYLAQNAIDPGAANITLEHIINQKYIALIFEHETFTDWRRTNFPTLVSNTGTPIPRRFPVPQSELNLNGANASYIPITKPVTWDN
ncbi:MAG: SusD/RagB family nutrient-binding outer membrane lipoprotein [Flavobacteriia bacterium]|nr:SusD/RagB family nutrient-binding outer membrane lipoprotein [Flavobacteriia bacterium]